MTISKNLNRNLRDARRRKNDEFYTRLVDIEKELRHYRHHFKGKVVYCNCDDPYISAFFEYFSKNFEFLGLKKLITTCYRSQSVDLFSDHTSDRAIKLEYKGGAPNSLPTPDDIGITYLEGDGDFRSKECIEILKEADIIVTNPPFSLFREYIAQLIEYDKQFLIIGNMNAITYKEVFPLIKEKKVWLGHNRVGKFFVPDSFKGRNVIVEDGVRVATFGNIYWYTNLDHKKRHEKLILHREYEGNEEKYPEYDNYKAIEVSRVANIPVDYDGVMGVPLTFLTNYNPSQFQLLGTQRWSKGQELEQVYRGNKESVHDDMKTTISGRETYDRIFIQHIRSSSA